MANVSELTQKIASIAENAEDQIQTSKNIVQSVKNRVDTILSLEERVRGGIEGPLMTLVITENTSCNNVVPEAQACGIPVITPSWGGSCEMVLDGKTGVIAEGGKWDYDQKYIQNLSNAVEKIIPDLNGYKLRARKHAVQSLNLDIMIKKYMKAMMT